ncbi:MAG: NfeD family protein [candidate division KSB1 bacterium]|nr:NfeD family protein [candidate division KSB1 bacterium]
MCHVILMMPIFGLGLFWLMPMSQALPLYGIIVLVSVLLYIPMQKAMHRPVMSGREGLLQQRAVVRRIEHGETWVHVHGELWQAESDETLLPGQAVEVIGQDGMTLHVRKATSRQRGPHSASCILH